MDSRSRARESTEGHEQPAAGDESTAPDGVDLTLIRWMLSLAPGERLEVLQRQVNALLALRGEL